MELKKKFIYFLPLKIFNMFLKIKNYVQLDVHLQMLVKIKEAYSNFNGCHVSCYRALSPDLIRNFDDYLRCQILPLFSQVDLSIKKKGKTCKREA